MKNVLIYCHVFYPSNSGYANAFLHLIESILAEDAEIEVTVVTETPLSQDNQELEIDRLTIERLNNRTNFRFIRYFVNPISNATNVSKMLAHKKYDLFLVETFEQAIFLSFLKKCCYRNMAVRIHATYETEYTFFGSSWDFRIRRWLIKYVIAKKIKWVLSTNNYHLDFAKQHFFSNNPLKIAACNFMVLPNPINVFSKVDCSAGEKIKVFSLGRMDVLGENQKGFSDFLKALLLLEKKHLDRLDITIVGDGELFEKLNKFGNSVASINFIKSMPHESVISNLLSSDIVVLPSRYEGASMFALEGLATGNACLYSEVGGLIDMITNNGIFFKPQDIESLADALRRFCETPNSEIEKMKKNSLILVEERFSKKVVGDKFKRILGIISQSE